MGLTPREVDRPIDIEVYEPGRVVLDQIIRHLECGELSRDRGKPRHVDPADRTDRWNRRAPPRVFEADRASSSARTSVYFASRISPRKPRSLTITSSSYPKR